MRVIKENNFKNVFPMRVTCKQVMDRYGYHYGDVNDFCGSELEIDAKDIKKHSWEKYPDMSGVDYGVICPVCGKFIAVPDEDLPRKIKEDAKEVRLKRR